MNQESFVRSLRDVAAGLERSRADVDYLVGLIDPEAMATPSIARVAPPPIREPIGRVLLPWDQSVLIRTATMGGGFRGSDVLVCAITVPATAAMFRGEVTGVGHFAVWQDHFPSTRRELAVSTRPGDFDSADVIARVGGDVVLNINYWVGWPMQPGQTYHFNVRNIAEPDANANMIVTHVPPT